MTREEAIEIVFHHGPGGPSKIACTGWIDLFQYLGMLKLDEPKKPHERALNQFIYEGLSVYDAQIYLAAIERAGLKIVEK